MTRNHTAGLAATGLIAALWVAALPGCGRTPQDGAPDGEAASLELPPMSEGTIQALGPHLFVGETRVEPAAGSSVLERTDRVELRWQDRHHYHLRRWADGEPRTEEIREDDLLLVRKARGRFQWAAPSPGPTVLRDTIVPGERALADVEAVAILSAEEGASETPRRFSIALAPAFAADDDAARSALEAELAQRGASRLPVALDGEAEVDELGNRTRLRVEYTYRVPRGDRFESATVTLVHEESREPRPDGTDLDIPPEAAVMLAEARSARAAADDEVR